MLADAKFYIFGTNPQEYQALIAANNSHLKDMSHAFIRGPGGFFRGL